MRIGTVVVLLSAGVIAALSLPERASAVERNVSSLTASPITVYGAKWCSACRALEKGLTERQIAFDRVDVDENPAAFARARAASGAGGSIPLTSIVRTSDTVWVVGADVDAVARAQRND